MLRGEGGVEVPVGGAGADGDEAGDAGRGGAVEDAGDVAALGEVFEVAVGVEEHGVRIENSKLKIAEWRRVDGNGWRKKRGEESDGCGFAFWVKTGQVVGPQSSISWKMSLFSEPAARA